MQHGFQWFSRSYLHPHLTGRIGSKRGFFRDKLRLIAFFCLSIASVMSLGFYLKPFENLAIAYDQTATLRVRQWDNFVKKLSTPRISDQRKVIYTQQFFQRLAWRSDIYQWGTEDFWATPLETIVANVGDCEDLAIAKYFTLLHAGVSSEKMRVSYVRSLTRAQAHVVLLFFPNTLADGSLDDQQSPWVIDNLETTIYTLDERQDLQYVYSFDQHSLWLAGYNQQLAGVTSREQITQWNALLDRLQQQL